MSDQLEQCDVLVVGLTAVHFHQHLELLTYASWYSRNLLIDFMRGEGGMLIRSRLLEDHRRRLHLTVAGCTGLENMDCVKRCILVFSSL